MTEEEQENFISLALLNHTNMTGPRWPKVNERLRLGREKV
jgi:hypothetical protein